MESSQGVWAEQDPLPSSSSSADWYINFAPGYRGPNPAPSCAPYIGGPKHPSKPPPPHLLKTVKRNSPEKKKEGEETVKKIDYEAVYNYFNTAVGEAGPRPGKIRIRGGKNLDYYNAKFGRRLQYSDRGKLPEDTPSSSSRGVAHDILH